MSGVEVVALKENAELRAEKKFIRGSAADGRFSRYLRRSARFSSGCSRVGRSSRRACEIDIRESLLKAAEKRIEARVEELKAVESRISTASGQKSEADAARFTAQHDA